MRELPKYVQVYNKILVMIKNAQLPPGSKLPSEEELTNIFSVSRVTLRLALSLLKEDGFINSIHGQGHFVNSTVETEVNKGLALFSNPLIESMIIPLNEIRKKEAYFFLNPSSVFTDKLFSGNKEPYYTLNIWYHYETEYIANTFAIILPKTVKKYNLNLENSKSIISFLENDIYNIAVSSYLTMSISSRESDSFRRNFNSEQSLVLLTENLYSDNGELIIQNKHYVLENFFKSYITRYKDNYNNRIHKEY